MYYMDKFVTESTESFVSVGKPKLSDPSISMPKETEVSAQVPAVEPENIEERLDIGSEIHSESLPDSASEISIPSSTQSLDGHQC